MNIFTIIACTRKPARPLVLSSLTAQNTLEDAFSQQKHPWLPRRVPEQRQCKGDEWNAEHEQRCVVANKLQAKVDLQDEVHNVATGPCQQHCDHCCCERVRLRRRQARSYFTHCVLGAGDYSAHERCAEKAASHKESVVHFDTGAKVVHADACAGVHRHRLSKLCPPEHDEASKDIRCKKADNEGHFPETHRPADHARVHADSQVKLEHPVSNVRGVDVEYVAVVMHKSKQRNDENRS